MYIIPGIENSVNSAVMQEWHYPVKVYDIHVGLYMKFILTKEIHHRKSTKSDPCSDLHEATFYQVTESAFGISLSL